MPPLHFFFLSRRSLGAAVPSSEFLDQWTHPGGVFSVLLILGGDVVGRALAQLAGPRLTPVSFSFGRRVHLKSLAGHCSLVLLTSL